MNNTGPNNQTLTTWGFVLALFGAILYFVSQGQFIFAALVVGLIPLMTLAREPVKWWLVAILFANSGLMIPGAGENITLSLAASAGFIGLALLDRIFHRTDSSSTGAPQRFAGTLVILLIGLASYRGWGLKFLGSSMWGGMQYIQLIVGLLFFFYSRQMKVDEKSMKRVVLFYFGMVFLPMAITVFSRYIPALSALAAIVRFEEVQSADVSDGVGVSRMQSLSLPATVLGCAALLIFDRAMKISWAVVSVAGLSLVLSGMSGHRGAFVKLGLISVIYALVRWRKIPQAVRVKGLLAAGCMLVMIYVSASFLPLGFQRVVTVLPGIKVDAIARVNAEGTSDWRIEMWRKMLPMIPKYLIVGRGAGFDLREAYGAYTLTSDNTTKHEFFIAVHNYHNGPLWALIDLGGAGALLLFGFMVTTLVRYGRRLSWNYSPFMGSVYAVFYSMLVAYFFFFLSVFGYHGDVVQMALISSILEVISGQAAPPATVSAKNQRPAPRRLMPKT